MTDRPRITINADGTYREANESALELLGVTLEELRTSSPGRFAVEPSDPETDEAFREAWESSGRPDIGGATSIKRADGTLVRIKFSIRPQDDGSFLALMDQMPDPVVGRTSVYTTGDVLAAWRDAERRLETLTPDNPEWQERQADIAYYRERYQLLFEQGRGTPA
jgi:PAS domain S-box-containing protein